MSLIFESAKENYERGRLAVSAFEIHQFFELIIKAELLKFMGLYPRTHDIVELLTLLSRYNDKVRNFLEKYSVELEFLSDIYINAKYRGRDYRRDVIEKLLRIAEELLNIV